MLRQGKNKKPGLFLDSSVFIAALLSPWGGSFRICQESHENRLRLYINKYVLAEANAVLGRKYPNRLRYLPDLLLFAKITVKTNPDESLLERYLNLIHPEDAPILAGAVKARTDFLVTLDRKDFMAEKLRKTSLPLIIVTPQTFFQEHWTR